MGSSNTFEFSHIESAVQVSDAITIPNLIKMVNLRISHWGELLVPILIYIPAQTWRPPSNINSGLYWFSGFCKVFNTTPTSDKVIFSILDINTYDDNYTNYIGRLNYGAKGDLTYKDATITWLKS